MKVMIKKIFIISLLLIFWVLFWCWEKNTKKITFEDFNIEIWNEFSTVSPASIENKQIVNKIIVAYKNKDDENYKSNLIITKSINENNLSNEDFTKINIDKLSKKVVWYQQTDTYSQTFKCNDKKINWIINEFKINDNLFWDKENLYTFLQLYFIEWDYWYIISFSTDNSDNLKTYKNYLKSIWCN